ncbi:hypothetical protein MWH28_05195 [Natroniella sulfidigena]|uniref:hypothetical protein n=1 Tax=Natroniella sulfidigena TaxID=723921 RepID=UPI00200A09A8|nr:hypothetical protein [Natroniella sulfidigena]MCK8816766.1 hypothetical protein [Natroniella sulfidigena]
MNRILFSAILSVGVTLGIGITLIRKNCYVRPLIIFVALYIIEQMIGYELGVDILRAAIPSPIDPEYGAMNQSFTNIFLSNLIIRKVVLLIKKQGERVISFNGSFTSYFHISKELIL